MSRSKKSRKPGGAPTAKAKLSKVELSNVEKRVRKKTGKKPGNRQQEAQLDNNSEKQVDLNKDPRIGSKKAIDLGGAVKTNQSKPAPEKATQPMAKTTISKQDPIAALRVVNKDNADVEVSLAQELANIEEDEQLQVILAKQDDDIALTQDEVEYFNNMMERHEAISVQLDDDEDEEVISSKSVSSEDDLWDKLDNSSLPDSNK
jgi:ribosome assembly protein YihI (activator of Der GTPase)